MKGQINMEEIKNIQRVKLKENQSLLDFMETHFGPESNVGDIPEEEADIVIVLDASIEPTEKCE